MRLYAEKGHSLNDGERLELGRLLLKMGLTVRLGKEKQGNSNVQFVEFYRSVEFGHEKAASSVTSTESGGRGNNSTDKIAQDAGGCQDGS